LALAGKTTMYHTIEFRVECWMDVEVSPKHWLEHVRVARGSRLQARVRAYVMDTASGPVEVADLEFEDGSATRQVRCSCFAFVD
jgi:hypothetical protein